MRRGRRARSTKRVPHEDPRRFAPGGQPSLADPRLQTCLQRRTCGGAVGHGPQSEFRTSRTAQWAVRASSGLFERLGMPDDPAPRAPQAAPQPASEDPGQTARPPALSGAGAAGPGCGGARTRGAAEHGQQRRTCGGAVGHGPQSEFRTTRTARWAVRQSRTVRATGPCPTTPHRKPPKLHPSQRARIRGGSRRASDPRSAAPRGAGIGLAGRAWRACPQSEFRTSRTAQWAVRASSGLFERLGMPAKPSPEGGTSRAPGCRRALRIGMPGAPSPPRVPL